MTKWVSGIFFLCVLLAGCGKEQNLVPNVPVNFSAPLSDPRLLRLSSPGGAVVFTGYGVSGIVIYRTTAGGYEAYDRCSTVNPEKACAVELDDPSFTATDPCSGAKYLLEDGSPAKAPAKTSLRRYNTVISGNSLQVTN